MDLCAGVGGVHLAGQQLHEVTEFLIDIFRTLHGLGEFSTDEGVRAPAKALDGDFDSAFGDAELLGGFVKPAGQIGVAAGGIFCWVSRVMAAASSLSSGPRPERPSSRLRSAMALVLLLPVPSLGTAASMFWWPGTSLGKGLFVFSKVWVAALPLVWLLWVERGRLSWSPPRQGGFGLSALLGLLIAGTIFGLYALTQALGWIDPVQVAQRASQTGLSHWGLYVTGAVYWITLNSLMEEYVWRWFCFRHFETLLGGKGAVLGAALGFTLHHVIALAGQFAWPMTVLCSVGVFCGGAIWSWLYLRYRSVWPCYVSHAIVDMPIFIVGYWMIFGS